MVCELTNNLVVHYCFNTFTLFNSTSNALLSCPVLVTSMLEDWLSIKSNFFNKPLMKGPILNKEYYITYNEPKQVYFGRTLHCLPQKNLCF